MVSNRRFCTIFSTDMAAPERDGRIFVGHGRRDIARPERSAFLTLSRKAGPPSRRRSSATLPSPLLSRYASDIGSPQRCRSCSAVLGGRSFSSDINAARSAFLYAARIASPSRRRSRTPLLLLLPLPSPLPFAFDPSSPVVLPCSQFLIDNFSKTRAIRNLIQLTQNNHHHQILIDNFNDPLPLQLILATTGNPYRGRPGICLASIDRSCNGPALPVIQSAFGAIFERYSLKMQPLCSR
jgi:hypothetical protein